MDYDSDEAVKKVYFEYLSERYRNDEGPRRMVQFESGHPAVGDLTAIKAAREAYEQNVGSGRAVDASRDALYGQFDREEIKKNEVDPVRYSKDLEYHQRMEVLIAAQVEQRRMERTETRQAELQQDGRPDRVAEQEIARENYERQMQKDTGNRDAERAAAREIYEKNVNPETRGQTVQQDQSAQLSQRSDRNNPNRYDKLRKPDDLGR
jgi:hypothetical protein